MLNKFVGFSLAILVAGCGLMPPKDALEAARRVDRDSYDDLKTNELLEKEAARLTWLGRAMQTDSERERFAREQGRKDNFRRDIGTELLKDHLAFEAARPVINRVGTEMMARGATPLGAAAGLMVLGGIGSMIGPDGSNEYGGQFYIPMKIDDKDVGDINAAFTYFSNFIDERMVVAGDAIGRKVNCFLGCDIETFKQEKRRIYTLESTAPVDKYAYIPPKLAVTVMFGQFSMASQDPWTTSALGFVPAYNGGVIVISFHNIAAEPISTPDIKKGFAYEEFNSYTYQRDFYKAMSDANGYLFLAQTRSTQDFGAYKGKLYVWSFPTSDAFIDEEVVDN